MQTLKSRARDSFGRYRILGELGRGAMGTVYRAVDPLIEREVAIKALLPNVPGEIMAQARERFLREARSAGRLNHPNIVTIFDVGEQDGTAYIAMELIEGQSLQQIMREPQRIAFDAVAEIVAQVADALDHAQQYKIVHRDIKPANVMVTPSERCKLTDFGVAYLPTSSMTQTGAALGSPRYMSPEQAIGVPVDGRSDIFSLGVVLYEMLVRTNPFVRADDTTPLPVMHRVAGEPHVPVREIDPKIPPAFDRILAHALAKKPQERYQRAADMAHDLRRALPDSARVAEPAFAKTDIRKQLLDDLEDFARKFDARHEAELHAAEAERLRKEAEVQTCDATEERMFKEFEAWRTGTLHISELAAQPARRGGAFDALRKQAAVSELDQSMRATFEYLAAFGREVSSVGPIAGQPYEFLYVGRLPSPLLSDARADNHLRRIDGKDCSEHIVVRYKVRPEPPHKTTLIGEDILRGARYLKALRVAFEVRTQAKNDLGKPTRAVFTIKGKLPCEIDIRADYDAMAVTVQLTNVRRIGRSQCRVSGEELKSLADDLARYVLGVDDHFEKVLHRK
jgi:serine/threonine protein kinase